MHISAAHRLMVRHLCICPPDENRKSEKKRSIRRQKRDCGYVFFPRQNDVRVWLGEWSHRDITPLACFINSSSPGWRMGDIEPAKQQSSSAKNTRRWGCGGVRGWTEEENKSDGWKDRQTGDCAHTHIHTHTGNTEKSLVNGRLVG